MGAKELLLACRNVVREISAIEEQLRRFGSIGGPRMKTASVLTKEYPVTNRPDTAQNQKIDAYEQVLCVKRQQAVDLLLQFEKLLEKVPDTTDRAILRYYFGAGWTDERIAEEMGLTDRTVRGRRKNTLVSLYTMECS